MPNKMIADEISKIVTKENELYRGRSASYLAQVRLALRKVEREQCAYSSCREKVDRKKRRLCPFHAAYYARLQRAKYVPRKKKEENV